MKRRKFQIVLPLFMVCIIGSGCVSKQVENNTIDMAETIKQTEISIENSSNFQKSSSAADTEEINNEIMPSTTVPESSLAETADEQSTNPLENETETTMETATSMTSMDGISSMIIISFIWDPRTIMEPTGREPSPQAGATEAWQASLTTST